MGRPRSSRPGPPHYEAIERALILFETRGEEPELCRVLAAIDHPAARRALALLAQGRPAGAEAVLEDALEAMAGPDSGAGLAWFSGYAPDRAA